MSQPRIILAGLIAACFVLACTFWWLCQRSDAIAFLPAASGAEWIVYPKPAEASRQAVQPLSSAFEREFTLASPPTEARLTFRAYKIAEVFVNGLSVPTGASGAERWKTPNSVDIARFLQAGTNVISVWVTNSQGPPALWLRLDAGTASIATDTSWRASLAGATWEQARLAKLPPEIGPGNALYGAERTKDSLKRVWPTLALFAGLSLALVLLLPRLKTHPALSGTKLKTTSVVLTIVLVARAALFIHDLPLLPRSKGFDAEAHQEYVQFIQQRHALPLAKDGWEMFQPPLYYLGGAGLLALSGYQDRDDRAGSILSAINGVAALVHCWLVLLCLQLLFLDCPGAQLAGLLVAAFLPPHLYLSQYITNEPLAGLFVTGAFYFCLRWLESEKARFSLGAGLSLGAAMLTKFSALLPVLIFPAAIGMHLLKTRNSIATGQKGDASSARRWLQSVVTMMLSCIVVCGWHYGRVWAESGRPIVGNWEASSQFAWWQDPGYRTSEFYANFGQALACPLFSALRDFGDGMYSTWWGDGLIGGQIRLAARPPWDYDLMNAGFLLALLPTLLLVLGFAVAVARFVHSPTPAWLAVLGMVGSFGGAVLYMSLRVPSYAQVKAFYAFPALAPFSALVAAGWAWLAQNLSWTQEARGGGRWTNEYLAKAAAWAKPVLWVLLLLWVFTTVAAFRIRSADPQTHLARGLHLVDHQRNAEAVQSLSLALQLDEAARASGQKPLLDGSRVEAHFNLGLTMERLGNLSEAIVQYREAIRESDLFDGALNNLAWILASSPNAQLRNGTEAVSLAERACALTQERITLYVGTLAAAYAEAGRFDEAIAAAQKAVTLARLRNQNEIIEANRRLLELYKQRKPAHWTSAGN